MRAPAMRVIGLAGWSGAGKTTLLRQLIPVLVAQGLRVSTLKHAHHEFDVDQPGKDSWEHRQAGAQEVLVASAHPDGIGKLAENLGIASRATSLVQTPIAGYELKFWQSPWLQKASAGLLGLLLISSVCLMLGRILRSRAAVTR